MELYYQFEENQKKIKPNSLEYDNFGLKKNNFFEDEYLKNSKICFILGSPRSGTTLVRLILECHAEVVVYDEIVSYEYWRERDLLRDEIKNQKHLGKTCFIFKTPVLTEQFNNPDFVARIRLEPPFPFRYEGQLLLFLVRDPRDVYLSIKKMHEHYDAGWVNRLKLHLNKIWPLVIQEFEKKYSRDLEIIKNSKKNFFLPLVALYWKIKNNAFFEYQKLGFKLLPIFYEDLVSSPKSNIVKMCKFLDIPFNQNMLRHHELDHSLTRPNGITIGRTDAKRAIDSNSINQYLGNLTSEEQQIILSIAGVTYEKMQEIRRKC